MFEKKRVVTHFIKKYGRLTMAIRSKCGAFKKQLSYDSNRHACDTKDVEDFEIILHSLIVAGVPDPSLDILYPFNDHYIIKRIGITGGVIYQHAYILNEEKDDVLIFSGSHVLGDIESFVKVERQLKRFTNTFRGSSLLAMNIIGSVARSSKQD